VQEHGGYSAHGLVPSIDWRIAHHKDPDCFAVSKVVDGAFKPMYGKPGKPYVCFRDDLKTLPAKAAVSG
jgi:hypothetical protein